MFLLAGASVAADLPERYRQWLEEEVVYIITPKEREVFLKLQTDRERDIFIEAFWKQRDPNPSSPQNEFRDEHYRRLNYANQFLGRGTGNLAGRQTRVASTSSSVRPTTSKPTKT